MAVVSAGEEGCLCWPSSLIVLISSQMENNICVGVVGVVLLIFRNIKAQRQRRGCSLETLFYMKFVVVVAPGLDTQKCGVSVEKEWLTFLSTPNDK